MTRRLNALYKCMKFCRILSYSIQVIERTRFVTDRQTQGESNVNTCSLHNYVILNKMTKSTYGYNVLNNHYHITSLWYLGVS